MKQSGILFRFLFSTLPVYTDTAQNTAVCPSGKFNVSPLDECLWRANAFTFNQICSFFEMKLFLVKLSRIWEWIVYSEHLLGTSSYLL